MIPIHKIPIHKIPIHKIPIHKIPWKGPACGPFRIPSGSSTWHPTNGTKEMINPG